MRERNYGGDKNGHHDEDTYTVRTKTHGGREVDLVIKKGSEGEPGTLIDVKKPEKKEEKPQR